MLKAILEELDLVVFACGLVTVAWAVAVLAGAAWSALLVGGVLLSVACYGAARRAGREERAK